MCDVIVEIIEKTSCDEASEQMLDDEYTERLALQTLAYIYLDKAEQYAIDFWWRDKYKGKDYEDEYQKI